MTKLGEEEVKEKTWIVGQRMNRQEKEEGRDVKRRKKMTDKARGRGR